MRVPDAITLHRRSDSAVSQPPWGTYLDGAPQHMGATGPDGRLRQLTHKAAIDERCRAPSLVRLLEFSHARETDRRAVHLRVARALRGAADRSGAPQASRGAGYMGTEWG